MNSSTQAKSILKTKSDLFVKDFCEQTPRIGKGPGLLNLHNSSSTACKIKVPLPSAAADSSLEGRGVVSRIHSSK